MKAPILAIATMLALAAGMTAGAMASNHKTGRGHVTRVHASATHGWARHDRGYAEAAGNAYDDSAPKSLGPLGFTFGCVHGYCGQGYSMPAWTY